MQSLQKHTSIVTTGSPETSGLPCAMVLTAYFVLSPVSGLFCHRRFAGIIPRNLTPASGRQDHTTSPSALVSLVNDTPASTASRLNVRDDREAPLVSRKSGRICERAVADQPPVAGTEPVAPQKR